MNVLQGRFLPFMPHQRLQSRNIHVLIRLVGAKGMPEGMDADLFADPGLFDVLGDNRLDR